MATPQSITVVHAGLSGALFFPVNIVRKLQGRVHGCYATLRVLRPVHVASLKQAYPSQREGALLSLVDTTDYAAQLRPRLQMEDKDPGGW